LEVRYKDKKIRDLCERQDVAEKKLGAASAGKLKLRLVALEAAARATDLVAGHPHPLKGNRLGKFALDLAGGWRLVFAPAHDPCPTRPDGGIEWSQVTIVSIEYIGDYHD
jgi:proteic killer suppression protein